MELKGLCVFNSSCILKYPDLYLYPGIKRQFKNISKNKSSKIQYGNALYLSSVSGVPLHEIIVI